VISGRLKPGERIIEEVIAEKHNVSRVPVREALRRLEAEGFVNLTPYRGATVAVPSRREGLELLTVRRGLEVLAARLAAERQASGFEHAIKETVAEEMEANAGHDVDAMLRYSLRFHELVLLAAGNEQLRSMLDKVLERIAWVFEIDLEERAAGAAADHAAIAHAILAGSAIQAGYLMDEHVAQDEALYQSKSTPGS
jgi:DNA-binding GntR family transcriptional regulator